MNKNDAPAGGLYTAKQAAILEVAERLFAERGFEGASVRDIAQEAGVNVAMISYYFGSKEKLLEAIVTQRISAGRLVLEHLLNDTTLEPLQKVDLLVDGIVDRMLSNLSYHRIMLRLQLDHAGTSIAEISAGMKLKNLELVTKLVQEGQRKKVFVKTIDIPMMMTTLVGTVYQAATGMRYLHAATGSGAESDEAYAQEIREKLKKHLKQVFKATLTYDGN